MNAVQRYLQNVYLPRCQRSGGISVSGPHHRPLVKPSCGTSVSWPDLAELRSKPARGGLRSRSGVVVVEVEFEEQVDEDQDYQDGHVVPFGSMCATHVHRTHMRRAFHAITRRSSRVRNVYAHHAHISRQSPTTCFSRSRRAYAPCANMRATFSATRSIRVRDHSASCFPLSQCRLRCSRCDDNTRARRHLYGLCKFETFDVHMFRMQTIARVNDRNAQSLNVTTIHEFNERPLHVREGGIRAPIEIFGAKREGLSTASRDRAAWEDAYAA